MAQTRYDLLLRHGHVIDPKNGVDGVRDVAVTGGKIAAVAENIAPSDAAKAIDVTGLYVTPGLLDIHVHAFHTTNVPDAWAGDNSVDPDAFSFRSCTTTMMDAGSAGYRNFDQFRATVINRVKTRLFALVNIAGYGMMTNTLEQDPADMLPEKVADVVRRNRDVVIGIKTAHYEKSDWTAVDRAIEAGKLANVPVMVDFGFFLPERPYWQLVTEKLRPGDISTHMYRSAVPWEGKDGKLYDYLRRARARGILFDVGHGGGSFAFRNAVPAVAQGFYPDSISTDLHVESMNAAMQDMPTTMSKFLAIGMPLKDIILHSTWRPAQMIHHEELGSLSIGSVADIAVLGVERGNFGYQDTDGGKVTGNQRLSCEMTFKDGNLMWDLNARTGRDWRQLPPDYGLRPGKDFIIPPPPGK